MWSKSLSRDEHSCKERLLVVVVVVGNHQISSMMGRATVTPINLVNRPTTIGLNLENVESHFQHCWPQTAKAQMQFLLVQAAGNCQEPAKRQRFLSLPITSKVNVSLTENISHAKMT